MAHGGYLMEPGAEETRIPTGRWGGLPGKVRRTLAGGSILSGGDAASGVLGRMPSP